MSTHALGTSEAAVGAASDTPLGLRVARNLDLPLLALALPLFVAARFPLLGYAVGAGAWLVQRVIRLVLERRAAASTDPRTVVGVTAASMIGRGWLVAGAIFGAGLADNEAGLAAAVLFLAIFTVHFTAALILRPFDEPREPSR